MEEGGYWVDGRAKEAGFVVDTGVLLKINALQEILEGSAIRKCQSPSRTLALRHRVGTISHDVFLL
jgi:hypothetical protein